MYIFYGSSNEFRPSAHWAAVLYNIYKTYIIQNNIPIYYNECSVNAAGRDDGSDGECGSGRTYQINCPWFIPFSVSIYVYSVSTSVSFFTREKYLQSREKKLRKIIFFTTKFNVSNRYMSLRQHLFAQNPWVAI